MNPFLAWVVIVISLVVWAWINMGVEKSSVDLVIGILSSQENFEKRSILRKGIHRQSTNLNIKLMFIVANEPCYIPVGERVDIYSCEPLQYSEDQTFYYSHDIVNNDNKSQFEPFVNSGPIGWDFTVLQEITIEELGFIDFYESGIKNTIIKISVYDKTTKQPILSAVFASFSPGLLYNGFRYKSVLNFNLSKGFRGTVVAEGVTKDSPMLCNSKCKINEGNGLLRIEKGFRFGKENGDFPESMNEHISNLCFFIGPSMKFRSNGILNTSQKENLYEEYSKLLKIQNQHLVTEFEEYGDILLVNLLETYRNLPLKMLSFYEWLSTSLLFDFVLKSDDDCYLNITGITEEIIQISKHGKNNVWIGNFREYFSLDKQGKWAEHVYKSITYPPFACGSGYILSSDLVDWIARNIGSLQTYQGEDTSLGIWLSAIYHKRIQEDKFQCFQNCKSNMFSLPENSIEQLRCLYSNDENIDFCKLCFG